MLKNRDSQTPNRAPSAAQGARAVSRKMILLRFDDICPTMNWDAWAGVEAALVERDIKPILAVVPDNQDPGLEVAPPAEDFWERMRCCQARGWMIALHGYQHRYVTKHRGLVGRREMSEFAGLLRERQDAKIRQGVDILRREGIQTTVWIAPSHTFDADTISSLTTHGIDVISDGFFRYPYRSKDGMLWVPQQLWKLQRVPRGVWTVCHHINGWTPKDVKKFRLALDKHRADIVAFEDVLNEYGNRRRRWTDWIYAFPRLSYYLLRIELRLRSLI